MTYMRVQVCRNPAGLNCHQITPDTVENGLENGDTLELGHSVVKDEATGAADGHGNQDWGPAGVENL